MKDRDCTPNGLHLSLVYNKEYLKSLRIFLKDCNQLGIDLNDHVYAELHRLGFSAVHHSNNQNHSVGSQSDVNHKFEKKTPQYFSAEEYEILLRARTKY